MKNAYTKFKIRSLRGSLTRFLSIMGIVLLGVGFLSGLLATTPDMRLTTDTYYDRLRLFDLDVKSTLGLTDEDIEAISALPGVADTMPVYSTDIVMDTDTASYATRIYGYSLANDSSTLNNFELLEGRMPENVNECLIAAPNGYTTTHSLGEHFVISPDNKDYENISDTYAETEVTAVGIVRSPYYISVEAEPTTVGNGSISVIMYVFPEFYSLDVYTDMFLLVEGAAELDTYSDAYSSAVGEIAARIREIAGERCDIRYNGIVADAEDEIAQAKDELADAEAEAKEKLQSARDELDRGRSELESAKDTVREGEIEISKADDEIADGRRALDEARKQYSDGKTARDAAEEELEKAKEALAAKIAAASSAGQAVPSPEQLAELEKAKNEIQSAESKLAFRKAELDKAREEIERKSAELDAAEVSVSEKRAELDDALAKISENEQKIADGEAEYEKSRADAEGELDEGRQKIADAEAEIANIKKPQWYVTDREDTVSFASYKSNSEKIHAIAKVFPVFFFVVAALVALTTMTRTVEEDRVQIGTLKALGYTKGKILSYYLGYSLSATLIGSFAGAFLGFITLPSVIANAYGMMYTLPPVQTPIRWEYVLTVIPIAVLTTTLATLWACLHELSEKPSQLMRPRAPKSGKRILLEYITPIWRRLGFIKKVTARNIFRYKKRLFMTVVGVAGCTALLVCGFGLRTSINAIVDKQFGEIYNYNLTVYLSDENAASDDSVIHELVASDNTEKYFSAHTESADVFFGGKSLDVNLLVPEDSSKLKECINLRERKSGRDVPFGDDGIVLTEKLCEKLGISVGDTVEIRNADGFTADFTVSGICENYVSAYAFIPVKQYEEKFESTPEYLQLFLRVKDDSQEMREQLSSQILKSENVRMVSFTQTIRESFENLVKSINYIVFVLIAAAGALAVIVVYNLTNINICERKKELATIKVLGFHDGESASYIYRETSVLCTLGILAGFVFGVFLHSFVVRTAEVDAVMFGRSLTWSSFALAALMTAVFTALVDLVMLPKLNSISMVESMKAND